MKELRKDTAFNLCKNFKAHSVSIGRKKVNGDDIGEMCVCFAVTKKLPKQQIKDSNIVPEKILYNGKTYRTDVQERPVAKFLDCCFVPCQFFNEETEEWEIIYESPIDTAQRAKMRPLTGGVSIGNYDDLVTARGTLGQLCIDERDNSIVGLTNAHVTVFDVRYNKDKELCYTIHNKRVTQPSAAEDSIAQDKWNLFISDETPQDLIQQVADDLEIGTCKRFWPIENDRDGLWQTVDPLDTYIYNEYNKIDACIISINSSVIDNSSEITRSRALGINGISNDFVPWATDAQMEQLIQDFENGAVIHVAKSGRTTGITGFNYENGDCPAIITQISQYMPVTYVEGRDESILLDDVKAADEDAIVCTFEDNLVFEYQEGVCPDCFGSPAGPLSAGDSGSVLVTNYFGGNVVIGLCFAGGGATGIANMIHHVRNKLNVRGPTIQDVQSALTFTDYSQASYITASGLNVESSGYIMHNGKKYWQIGNAPPSGSV